MADQAAHSRRESATRDLKDLKFRQLAQTLRREIQEGVWPPGGRLPTEHELARRSGTSIATVRRAVDDLVSEQLVVRRQGSGTFVLAPQTGATRRAMVGVMVPDTAVYYPKVLKGIEKGLSEAGAHLLLACSNYDQIREARELQGLIESGVDGLLLVPTLTGAEPGDAYLRRLAELPVPTVLIERRGTSLGDLNEHVCTHHEAGAYDAVHHLARLGHRTIALVMRAPGPTADHLARGFDMAVAELGCNSTTFQVPRQEWSAATADRCLQHLRATGATAALCHSDRQAALLLSAARRAGVSVPEDLALVSYDDEIADIADIPLTAVAPPKHLLGQTAAETLLHRLDHPEQSRRKILLQPSIVIRASCGAYRSNAPIEQGGAHV